MEYMDLVRKRRIIRRYHSLPVSAQDLKPVLEAARLAPFCGNRQCWRYIIVTDQSIKKKLAQAGEKFINEAPVIIVACADPKDSHHRPGMDYYMVDVGISFEHLILAAKHLELWEIKTRPPPRATAPPKAPEYYIDYTDSQLPVPNK